jgi:hypothetical protein
MQYLRGTSTILSVFGIVVAAVIGLGAGAAYVVANADHPATLTTTVTLPGQTTTSVSTTTSYVTSYSTATSTSVTTIMINRTITDILSNSTALNYWKGIANGSDYATLDSNGVLTVQPYSCENFLLTSGLNQTAVGLISEFSGELFIDYSSSLNTYMAITYSNLGTIYSTSSTWGYITIPIGSSIHNSEAPDIQFCNDNYVSATITGVYAGFSY